MSKISCNFAGKFLGMEKVKCWLQEHEFWRALLYSLVWITLLLFFTYTPLFSAAVHVSSSFMKAYYDSQSHIIAMAVNFGLVFMLVVDAWGAGQDVNPLQQVANYMSFFLVIGIYWHARSCQLNTNGNLWGVLGWGGFGVFLHVFLLIILLGSKTWSLYCSINEEGEKASEELG